MDAAFIWDKSFITDLPDVDEQHQELVALFNEIQRALFAPADASREAQVGDVYKRLLAYTEYHFREEEELMQSIGLDERHLELHRNLHLQFVEQIHLLWSQRAHWSDAGTPLVGFLTSWLGLHILGVDQSMARQIAAIECGTSPGEAFESERDAHDKGTQVLLKMIGRLYAVLSTQNAQLARANENLEERVAQRTRELEQLNARLHALSRTDALMGIANRAHFNERLEQVCAQARRAQRPLALVMIDVDHFKRYNDYYGHPQGDACLQAVARAVGGCVQRETDLLARYGGEELVAILTETDERGALEVAMRMLQAVRNLQLAHADAPLGWVTISAGVHVGVPPVDGPAGSGSAAMVARADAALYRAKQQGRDRCVVESGI